MSYREEDFLQLSGIQHYSFCKRQWALIHVEEQWEENLRTVEGKLLHERAHDVGFKESRGDTYILRGVSIRSYELGVSGQCDVLEFHRTGSGVPLEGKDGLWRPYPIEYKRGKPKETDADRLQLCAQALCLEEMLCCDIPEGALYYGETKRREKVEFTDELRSQVKDALAQMHELYRRGYTPKVRQGKACRACSLRELCLPGLQRNPTVASYLKNAAEEMP